MSTKFEKNRRGPALPRDLPSAIAEIKYLQGAVRKSNNIRMKLFTMNELTSRSNTQLQNELDRLRKPIDPTEVPEGNSDTVVQTCQDWLTWLGYSDAAAELTSLKGEGGLDQTREFLGMETTEEE